MSSYGFIKELIEKEHTPTPAYVFDLNKMKEFVPVDFLCNHKKLILIANRQVNTFYGLFYK